MNNLTWTEVLGLGLLFLGLAMIHPGLLIAAIGFLLAMGDY